jgi:hypothetical protein
MLIEQLIEDMAFHMAQEQLMVKTKQKPLSIL